MADKKISALPSASTPLTGSEVLPVVQGGVTDKVSVNNLTAGRTVPATRLSMPTGSHTMYVGFDGATDAMQIATQTEINLQTGAGYGMAVNIDSSHNVNVSQGNVKLSTAGKGIDFSANANAPGMTSEVLNWYEEGTWTPTAASASGTITTYTSSGRYTRVGNLVYVTGVVGTADIGTASGKMTVGGLPFAGAPNYQSGLAHEVINTGTSYFCALANGATSFTIQTFANGGITWGNASQYHFSFVYRV